MERVASHRSGQRTTEITRKNLLRLQKLSCSRSWHQSIVDCRRERDSMKETLRGRKESGWASQRRTPSTSLEPRMVQWERDQSEDWSRQIAQKLHCCSRYKKYRGTWYQTHRVVGDARDIRHLHRPATSPRRPDRRKIRPLKRQRTLPFRTIAHLSEPERTSAKFSASLRTALRTPANLSEPWRTWAIHGEPSRTLANVGETQRNLNRTCAKLNES